MNNFNFACHNLLINMTPQLDITVFVPKFAKTEPILAWNCNNFFVVSSFCCKFKV